MSGELYVYVYVCMYLTTTLAQLPFSRYRKSADRYVYVRAKGGAEKLRLKQASETERNDRYIHFSVGENVGFLSNILKKARGLLLLSPTGEFCFFSKNSYPLDS